MEKEKILLPADMSGNGMSGNGMSGNGAVVMDMDTLLNDFELEKLKQSIK